MKLKNTHLSISLLILIVSLTVAGTINQSVNPQYKLETPKASAGEITIITPENKTYTEPDSGYYPGTHGFECDKAGQLPLEFEILHYPDSASFIEIDEELAGHKKVCEIRKAGGTVAPTIITYFDGNTSGTIELWMYKDTDSSTDITQIFVAGIGYCCILSISEGDVYQHAWGSRTIIASDVFSKNVWHHIRIDFNLSLGWQFALDGVWYGLGYSFPIETPTLPEVINVHIGSGWSGVNPNYGTWIDAFGYSWNPNYNIGDNLNEGLLLGYDNSTNLDWQGYSFDGQPNRTILGNTTIPMPSDGIHSIQVFGNDSVGTMYESNMRYFTVLTNPPDITINSPTPSQTIGTMAPSYDISITGLYDSIWYTLDGGTSNITANSLIGAINQAAWTALADGIITIDFYANNSAGMEGTAQVMVVKDSSEEPPPVPPGIPGYNLILLIGVISVISLIIIKKCFRSR